MCTWLSCSWKSMASTQTLRQVAHAAKLGSSTKDDEDDWEKLSQNEPQDRRSHWEVLANRSYRNSLIVIEDLDAIGGRNFDHNYHSAIVELLVAVVNIGPNIHHWACYNGNVKQLLARDDIDEASLNAAASRLSSIYYLLETILTLTSILMEAPMRAVRMN